MSIRFFVSLCSLLLMVWLVAAFAHQPSMRGGVDPVSAEEESTSQPVEDPEDLTVSVSP